ncbi:MAG: hypothetical protein ACLT8E_05085 [Akkermansia sp.]
MDPEEIGWGATELPLTKHSGRHAVKMPGCAGLLRSGYGHAAPV